MNMIVSSNLVGLMGQWESREPRVYPDSSGLPSIGTGHLLSRDELRSGKIAISGELVKYRDGLSDEQIDALLRADLAMAVYFVNLGVRVPLTQNQFDALVSFAFNVGGTAFHNSTLRRLLNDGHYEAVPVQMRRWVHDHYGKEVQGLKNRREKEIALWLEGAEGNG